MARHIISTSNDGSVIVREKGLGHVVAVLHHGSPVQSVVRDDGHVSVGCKDGTVHIWTVDAWAAVTTLKGRSKAVGAPAADDQYLYSGSSDGTVVVWRKGTW